MTEVCRIANANVPVVPQPHARLRHYLTGEDFQQIMSGDYSSNAYRILGVLIPALPEAVPEYVWEGYADQATLDRARAGEDVEYDEEAAGRSPDFDQITRAFEVAIKVNGGERLGKLLGLVKTVQGMGEKMATMPTAMPSSLVTHGVNGA